MNVFQAAYFDVALIRTERIEITNFVRPVCLPESSSTDVDKYKNDQMHLLGEISSTLTDWKAFLKRFIVIFSPSSICKAVI
jgi:hypothetical protein